MKKICVITGSRAEYGLLYWTMKKIQLDPHLQLQICVTGMHLSPEYGSTYMQIEYDGFVIDEKVEILLSSDTSVGVSKSMGLAMIGFTDSFQRLKPDLIIVLGDRFEIFAATSTALIAKIPVAHCHGGEITEGAYDESIRHSITKMSHIHFASTETYCKRIIQLGESPSRVFNVGGLGIENIQRLNLLGKSELEKEINFTFGVCNFLVTFHPVTLENSSAEDQFCKLLEALDEFENAKIIFTKPNADNEGRIISVLIDKYVKKNPQKSISFISMGQLRYLSALLYIDVVIGNSSSGIIEVPSFKKATINIGDRQKGRIQSKTTINCFPVKSDITKSIHLALSFDFQEQLKNASNPYEQQNTSDKIVNIIKTTNLNEIIKKKFYDIPH
jgi:GDP/UDP-N,N'-diacetylbacillosamine 2-epimerase (hydrolysing)